MKRKQFRGLRLQKCALRGKRGRNFQAHLEEAGNKNQIPSLRARVRGPRRHERQQGLTPALILGPIPDPNKAFSQNGRSIPHFS
jgi:hypothetical protein